MRELADLSSIADKSAMRSRYFYLSGPLTSLLLAFALTVMPTTSALADPHKPAKVVVPLDLQARFYATAIRVKEQMLDDYRTLLHVYYELKKSSARPNEFPNPIYDPNLAADFSGSSQSSFASRTRPNAEEFDIGMYNEFAAVLDNDPRLNGNVYVRRMKEIGIGGANDIFQRVHGYALAEFISHESVDAEIHKRLRIDIAADIRDLALYEAGEVFNEASKASGYSGNKTILDLAKETEMRTPVTAKAEQLRFHLKKIGFVVPPTRSAGATCANAFSKLAK